MDYDSIQAAGSFFGSAAIIVVDDRCCMVQLALRAAQFYMHESCGKCTPCRVGTRWLVQLLTKIEDGRRGARPTSTCSTTSATACSASRSARSATSPSTRFELPRASTAPSSRRTSTGGGCPFGGESSIEGVLAPIDAARAPVARGRRMAELVTLTVDDRAVQVPAGTGPRRGRAAAGVEIPVFCYEPRLGPPIGACRMCLVEIEGIPKLQAGCTLTVQEGMVIRTARDVGEGGGRPGGDARVHPRQPPPRLPGLRQGRRVPAPGPDVPLRARARRA